MPVYNGTNGYDSILGSLGDDSIYGNGGGDRLDGNDGNDFIDGGDGDDNILGGFGNDTLFGSNGNDILQGGSGDDLIHGDVGNDQIEYLVTGVGNDTYYGDAGADTISVRRTQGGLDTVYAYGGDGDDSIIVQVFTGESILDGGDGNDRFDLSTGARMSGGLGRDLFFITDSYRGIGGFVFDQFDVGPTGDIFDVLSLYRYFTNYTGAVSPFASGHFQLLQDGTTTLFTLSQAGANTGLTYVGEFKNTVATTLTTDNFRGLNTMNGTDNLTGTANADWRFVGGGNDTVYGLGGNDTVIAGEGSDVLAMGLGDDLAASGGYIDGFRDGRGTSASLDYIYAGDGNDTIRGTGRGVDVLLGEAGNDTVEDYGGSFSYLFGGAGNNVMRAASLTNVFISEGLSDFMSSALTGTTSTFDINAGTDGCPPASFYYRLASGSSTVTGGTGIDQFIGGAALSDDSVSGGASGDYLFGGSGNDYLSGGADGDVIIGQIGNDTLEGGGGVNLLWANDAGSDEIRIIVADGGTQAVEFFEAGGATDYVRLIGSTLTSFADIQNLVTNIGVAQGVNLMVNAGSGAQLYLNLGANQTAIWFQGVSAYSLTSGDFLFS